MTRTRGGDENNHERTGNTNPIPFVVLCLFLIVNPALAQQPSNDVRRAAVG